MRQETLKLVCIATDPAVDIDGMGEAAIREYVSTRDEKLVKVKPGEKPTTFYVGEVPHELWSYVAAAESDHERAERAFQCAVTRVDNFVQSDGVAVGSWKPSNQNGQRKAMPEADMALFSPSERLEIGGVAYNHSFFPRRTDAFFRLPPLLAGVLARRIFRHADASQTSAPETSTEKPSDPTSPSSDATASDSATAAEASG